jgi:hypothetical protein
MPPRKKAADAPKDPRDMYRTVAPTEPAPPRTRKPRAIAAAVEAAPMPEADPSSDADEEVADDDETEEVGKPGGFPIIQLSDHYAFKLTKQFICFELLSRNWNEEEKRWTNWAPAKGYRYPSSLKQLVESLLKLEQQQGISALQCPDANSVLVALAGAEFRVMKSVAVIEAELRRAGRIK